MWTYRKISVILGIIWFPLRCTLSTDHQGSSSCTRCGLISCMPVTLKNGDVIPTVPKLTPEGLRLDFPYLPEGLTHLICRIPDCLSMPCLNDGTCTETMEGYNCTCQKTYYGTQCEQQDRFITSVSLLGGSSNEGRVAFTAINDQNQTKYFLRNSWTMQTAHLVCRYLGYSGVFATVSGDLYDSSDLNNLSQFGEISCPPDPQIISECWYVSTSEQNTSLVWNVAVMCCAPQMCDPYGERLRKNILDSFINESSCWKGWSPDLVCGRAGRIDGVSAWTPYIYDYGKAWVLIHLGEEDYLITGVLTQGRDAWNQWASSYYISYTMEGTWTKYTDIYNGTLVKIFPGNYDENSHVMNVLQPPIVTRNIKIHPTMYEHSPSMRFDIVGIKSLTDQASGNGNHQTDGCVPLHGEKLGMEDGRIENASITASSLSDHDQGAFYARLNLDAISGVTPGAWVPNTNDPNPWLKIDLVTDHRVAGVITQGRGHPVNKDWTTSFSLSFSTNDVDWQEWEECGSTRVFPANYDKSSPVTSLLPKPVVTRLVRIHPRTYAPRGVIALRCEVLGYTM